MVKILILGMMIGLIDSNWVITFLEFLHWLILSLAIKVSGDGMAVDADGRWTIRETFLIGR